MDILASNARSDVILQVCYDQPSRCTRWTYLFGRTCTEQLKNSRQTLTPLTISLAASTLLLASTLTLFYAGVVSWKKVAIAALFPLVCMKAPILGVVALRRFYKATPMDKSYEEKFIKTLQTLIKQNQLEKAYIALNEIMEYLDNQPQTQDIKDFKNRVCNHFIFNCIFAAPDNIDLLHRLIIDYVDTDSKADEWYAALVKQATMGQEGESLVPKLEMLTHALSLIGKQETRDSHLTKLATSVSPCATEGLNAKRVVLFKEVVRDGENVHVSYNQVVRLSKSVLTHLDHTINDLEGYVRPFTVHAHICLNKRLPARNLAQKTLVSQFEPTELQSDRNIEMLPEQQHMQQQMQKVQDAYINKMREIRASCRQLRTELLQKSSLICMRFNHVQVIKMLRAIDQRAVEKETQRRKGAEVREEK